MIVLDISIVIMALPQIHRTLDFSATALSWVQNAYLLALRGLLLLGARAGDLLGRRRMLVVGLGLFTIASVAVGTAQTEAWLMPWRVGFFINAPIGIALMLAAPRYLPETERRSGQSDAGAVSSTAGMTALVYGIVRSADAGWTDALTLAAVVAGVVLLALFVLNERRASQPIMPLRLFASRERAGAYAARLLFLGAMAPFWFFTTQFLQSVAGYSPVQSGLAFLPTTVINFAAAIAVPRLTRRLGNATLLAGSLAISVVGMAWLGRLSAGTPYLTGIALPMMLIGAGQGGALGPLTAAGIAGVDPEDAGAAGGLTNVAHQLGGSLGLGVLVAVFAAADSTTLHGVALLAHRIGASLTAGAGLLALALVAALSVRPRRTVDAGDVHEVAAIRSRRRHRSVLTPMSFQPGSGRYIHEDDAHP